MQPQTPQKPVMDVKVPPRPAVQPQPQPQAAPQSLAVHEPPKEDGPMGSMVTPEAAKEAPQKPAAEKQPKIAAAQPTQKFTHPPVPMPTGAIIFAVFAMIALSALAVAVYLQTQ